MPDGSHGSGAKPPFIPGRNKPPKFEDVVFSLPDPLRMRCEELREALAEYPRLAEGVVYDKGRGGWSPTWSLDGRPLVVLQASWTSVEISLYLTPEQADAIADAARGSPGSFRNWWSGARAAPGEILLNAAIEKGMRRAKVVLESSEDARGLAWLLAPILAAHGD